MTTESWTPLYLDYITHYGITDVDVTQRSFRRSTITIAGNVYTLSKWYKGCGFSPETVAYSSMEEAKKPGEEWFHNGV